MGNSGQWGGKKKPRRGPRGRKENVEKGIGGTLEKKRLGTINKLLGGEGKARDSGVGK